MRIVGAGHAIFAMTLIGLGAWAILYHHFAPIWTPVPSTLPYRNALLYITGTVTFVSGMGLLHRHTAAFSARLLLVFSITWLLVFKIGAIFLTPMIAVRYESAGETAVIVAAAWVTFVRFGAASGSRFLNFAAGSSGIRLARTLFGLALIAFGVSHLAYLKFTASLVPQWLPMPKEAWAAGTGCAYLAAGGAVLSNIRARIAATLSVAQMGGFTLLVWLPLVAAGRSNASDRSELAVSWTLTVGGWLVADSYRRSTTLGRPAPGGTS